MRIYRPHVRWGVVVRVIRVCGLAGRQSNGRSGQLVPAAQGAEEVVEGGVQSVGEGVPGLQRADGAALLDLDDGAPGQAAAGGKLVVAPPARGPQTRELQPQRIEVRIGRQDRHPSIRRCRPLPCQCRPLPYFSQVALPGERAEVCTTVGRRPAAEDGTGAQATGGTRAYEAAHTMLSDATRLDRGTALARQRAPSGLPAMPAGGRPGRRGLRPLGRTRPPRPPRPRRPPPASSADLPVPRTRLPLAPPSPRLRRPHPPPPRLRTRRTALATRRCLQCLRCRDSPGRRRPRHRPARHPAAVTDRAATPTTAQRPR